MNAWTPIDKLPGGRLPGGHHLFQRPGSSNVYIIDESGATPDTTADGPMWLDMTEDIRVSKENHVTVGVVKDDHYSADYRVPISMADALVLSDRYGMTIRCAVGGSFRGVRTR